jgi:hypothetical protein
MGWVRHSVRAAGLVAPGDRRARSDAPYPPSPAACRAANSPYSILGLLPDPEGGLSDITGLCLDKFSLLPAGQRIFIQTVQQINGWRDLPPKPSPPASPPSRPSARKSQQKASSFQPIPWLCPPWSLHVPLYTPCIPRLNPL